MDPLAPKPGETFPHARYLKWVGVGEGTTGKSNGYVPVTCRVTRVTKTTVWYRVGVGIGPATHRSNRNSFPQKVSQP